MTPDDLRRVADAVARVLARELRECPGLSGAIVLEFHCKRGTPEAVHAVRFADRIVEKIG